MSAARLLGIGLLTAVYLLVLGSAHPLDLALGLLLATAVSIWLHGRLQAPRGTGAPSLLARVAAFPLLAAAVLCRDRPRHLGRGAARAPSAEAGAPGHRRHPHRRALSRSASPSPACWSGCRQGRRCWRWTSDAGRCCSTSSTPATRTASGPASTASTSATSGGCSHEAPGRLPRRHHLAGRPARRRRPVDLAGPHHRRAPGRAGRRRPRPCGTPRAGRRGGAARPTRWTPPARWRCCRSCPPWPPPATSATGAPSSSPTGQRKDRHHDRLDRRRADRARPGRDDARHLRHRPVPRRLHPAPRLQQSRLPWRLGPAGRRRHGR